MSATPQMLPNSKQTATPMEISNSALLEGYRPENHGSAWQQDLKQAIRTPGELCERLGLDPEVGNHAASEQFPVVVPESFLKRMKFGDPGDPLLRQVLPVVEENVSVPEFVGDPVGDLSARTEKGLLQKYRGRALLIVNGVCAIHCRYCFRREYPYLEEPKSLEDWQPALDAVAADHSLSEVILSGGDPLMMTDARLAQLIGRIAEINHIQRIRIHSRLPIVLPSRVDQPLIDVISGTRLQTVFVVHANHPAELVNDCADALRRLVQSGIPTLNQAVLLRGINDSVESLELLCKRCVNLGVMPYYLHQLDRVSGAAHFEVPVEQGQRLIEQLRERLPGYAVPKYVQEIVGEPSKTPLL